MFIDNLCIGATSSSVQVRSPARVESACVSIAAKRHKNAAHGASRGQKCKADKALSGGERLLSHANGSSSTHRPKMEQRMSDTKLTLMLSRFCL